MGNRLSKIYTRTGDDGSTGLGDGTRVSKDSARVTAYGTVDELNSALGVVIACGPPAPIEDMLTEIQHELFDLGGELCIPGQRSDPRRRHRAPGARASTDSTPTFLRSRSSSCRAAAWPLRNATSRAPSRAAPNARWSRCRTTTPCVAEAMRYLNRLSDLLFVLARVLARSAGHGETLWKHERRKRG